MEDSEKRRERLELMRAIAAQAETSNNGETSDVQGLLANPLLESPANLAREESSATPRFDFYTDPSAAFSANRKRSATGNQVAREIKVTLGCLQLKGHSIECGQKPLCEGGQMNPEVTPSRAYQMQNNYSPANQMQSNYSPNQRMYRGRGPYHNTASYRSPRGFASPFPMNQGPPTEMWSGSDGPTSYYSSAPHIGLSSPYPIRQGNPGSGLVGSSPSPVSGYRGSPASSGRGQEHWHSNSGFGWSGGRGQGFRSRGFAPNETLGPDCFYDNSMVEDPWQHLEPVLWRGLDDLGNNLNGSGPSNSWLPKSISMKKPRVSESSTKSTSGQSLAEYLAASFNEAANNASSG
ncbi:unnamed protein product [Dovyalis caffra]|uniref:Uncharacterized protein n=1 Tax=Dovyalis caffra TaxID=77055 RepID=A0AAV1SA82_9ROSI|nr:unnamed protein product [Dovyalis caffra]